MRCIEAGGLLLIDIDVRHAAVFPIVLEMDGVAREQECAGLRQLDQQRLMARRVSGRRDDASRCRRRTRPCRPRAW